MKNLTTHLNTFGLLAILVAAGLVFTQSAFKPANTSKTALIYGYDQTNPEHPWVLDGTEGYRCISSQKFCKYIFETPPSQDTTPEQSTPLSTDDTNRGDYQAE